MSQSLHTGPSLSGPLGTTSARLVAVRLKSANKHIFRALLSLSSANLLVRLMGLVNTVIVTAHFGQGPEMDAYFVASTLPILLAQLLASSLEGSVIPVYAGLRTKGGREQASRFFSTLLNLLILGAILLTAVMFIFREQLLYISAPGTSAGALRQTVALAPFVFPVLGFMILNNYMECLLNAEGTFGWPAYAGLLVPLTTSMFILLIGGYGGVLAIGIGTLVGQCIQLCVIIIRARKSKIKYQLILDLHMPEMKAVATTAWPSLLGGIIGLASPLVDQIFASYLTGGTIAAINNALKISSVATGVIFAATGRAALPYLAAQAATKDMKAFKATLRLYLWGVTMVTLVLSVIMIVFAQPIISLLFQRGAFDAEDVQLTAITLQGFAIGLAPMAVGFTLAKAFNALGKTRFLMFVTLFNVISNAIFNAIFGSLWQSFGIAFATSLFYFCSVFILVYGLQRAIGDLQLLKPPPELLRAFWESGLEPYHTRWLAWQENNLTAQGIPLRDFYQQISRWLLMLMVFVLGVYGSIANGILTIRIAFGSLIILILLRYQYLLLLFWASINVFIGSPLPFFNGNNLLSGLTLPTFLLLFYLPTKVAFKRMVALPFLLTFLLWILFSFWYSPISLGQFFTSWSILFNFFSVCVLVVLVINTQKRLFYFIDAVHLPAIFIAAYGIWGYFTRTVGILDSGTGNYRVTSIFTQTPPGLALYFSILMPLTVYRIVTLRGMKRLAGIAVFLLFLVTVALTFSRGSLVIIPLSAIFTIPFLPGRKAKAITIASYLVVGVLTVVAATALNISIFDRFLNSDLMTLNGRTFLWQTMLDHFDPTRLQGYGYQASEALLTELQVGFLGVIATSPHNIFLEIMYNHGLIGLALLILVFAVQGASLVHKWFTTRSIQHRVFLALAMWAFISVVIQCNETGDIWNQQIGIYFFMFMALPFAVCWIKEEQSVEIKEKQGTEAIENTSKAVT